MWRPHLPAAGYRAFTLIEILIVVSVIVILMGMVLAAAGVIRKSVHRAACINMVQDLQAAITMYMEEDVQHRFPPAETDLALRSNWFQPSQPQHTLDLLAPYHVPWRPKDLDATNNYALLDYFGRPYQYEADFNATATAAAMTDVAPWAPGAQPVDWNAKVIHPFAYVWSAGAQVQSDAYDLSSANINNWLYSKTSP